MARQQRGITDLQSEIITHILKRLPIKSIVQLRCVCKEWKDLFKTPYFISQHSQFHSERNNNRFLLLLHEFNDKQRRSSLRLINHDDMETVDFLNIPSMVSFKPSWRIVDSCNGLLCVEPVNVDLRRSPRSLCLWNPVIREVRELPKTLTDHNRISACGVGFGFSSVLNDYKIVRLHSIALPQNMGDYVHDRIWSVLYHAEVFSLSTGSWKQLQVGPLLYSGVLVHTVNIDGTIFWLVLFSNVVISFDLVKEVVTLTELPTENSVCPHALAVYKNKLVVLYRNNREEESGTCFICAWVMEEVDSESGKGLICTEKYRIEDVSYAPWTKLIWRNEIVCLECKYVTRVEGEPNCVLHLLNLYTNEERKFNCSTGCDRCHVFNYEKSLVSVWNTHQVEM